MHYRNFVHLQVAAAIATIAVTLFLALRAPALPLATARADVFLQQAIWLALPLATFIFLVMLKRGRSADLILGIASKQSLNGLEASALTNTVEQTLLAVLALAAFISTCPNSAGAVIDAFVWIFLLGRVLFYAGYRLRPMWRFFGFSLNFYSSLALIALAAYFKFAA